MVRTLMSIRDWSRTRMRCVVCEDECATLYCCSNGHGCCIGCNAAISDERCPVCRDARSATEDETLRQVLTVMRARHHCAECNIYTSTHECERHRAWCPSHKFTCPVASCRHTVCGAALAHHVRHHDRHVVEVGQRFVMLVNHFSDDVVLVVDNDVVVVSFTPRAATSVNDMMSGGIFFSVRCYYASPETGVLCCTVQQVQVSHTDYDYVEEYNVGAVPAMLASREHVVVSPYTPRIVPRCVDTSSTGLRTPVVIVNVAGEGLVERILNYGIRDVPWVTRPTRDVTLSGPPVCVLRVRFDRRRTPVGSVFVE